MSNLIGRHFISCEDFTKDEIEQIIDESIRLKAKYKNNELTNYLINKTLFMIFFEQSTRTRNSMEAGMTQLGGHAHDLTSGKMQISHGETPRDTAKVLSEMGEVIAIRNCFHGIGNKYLNDIAKNSDIPLISMQDDIYHPLQAIADLMTIQEVFGKDLSELKVAVSWAYATSHAKPLSVPQSQILLFPRFGLNVVVGHPEEFPLEADIVDRAKSFAKESGAKLEFVNDMDACVEDADIVIPKNWGGFAHFDEFVDDDEHFDIMKNNLEKHKDWIFDSRRRKLAGDDCKIMHALPADRGNEITDEVLDSPDSIIYQEAGNRLHTAKGLLSLLLEHNG
ncbi:MAG: ornithine carbamoyltransferase [Candidatus Zixiibacteriota bacterium]